MLSEQFTLGDEHSSHWSYSISGDTQGSPDFRQLNIFFISSHETFFVMRRNS